MNSIGERKCANPEATRHVGNSGCGTSVMRALEWRRHLAATHTSDNHKQIKVYNKQFVCKYATEMETVRRRTKRI